VCKQRSDDTERTTLATPDAQRQAFIGHALTFALVIGGLAVLNLATSPHYPWFLWPLFGWGIGLAKQGLALAQAQSAAGHELTLDTPGVEPRAEWTREERRYEEPDPSARPWPDLE
jgi:uncharacterized membrane protein